MSELINNSTTRKMILKQLILKLHNGESEQKVRQELIEKLSQIPYGEVVEVEQELISEGLPEKEILKLCDVHSAVLRSNIDLTFAKKFPGGHPVDTMIKENEELKKLGEVIEKTITEIKQTEESKLDPLVLKLRGLFNNLFDVDKHYRRKEYLLFPFLENKGITGPPKVMWGKHDEIRELIKGSIEILQTKSIGKDELLASAELILIPAIKAVIEMTKKEEEILLPMSMEKLTEADWYEINRQSLEIGFCLYDPKTEWRPEWTKKDLLRDMNKSGENIQLPSGSFSIEELMTILNTLPIDITFVNKDDKVKYFSQGQERIFQRSRAILNRDVRHCHPPASAHIVDKIINDFKSGTSSRAPFWINMGDKMIHIEYFALRNEKNEYLGTLEVSHDISGYRKLEGEQRILSYSK